MIASAPCVSLVLRVSFLLVFFSVSEFGVDLGWESRSWYSVFFSVSEFGLKTWCWFDSQKTCWWSFERLKFTWVWQNWLDGGDVLSVSTSTYTIKLFFNGNYDKVVFNTYIFFYIQICCFLIDKIMNVIIMS